MLADDGVVAHTAECLAALPAEILRVGAHYGALVYLYILAQLSIADN